MRQQCRGVLIRTSLALSPSNALQCKLQNVAIGTFFSIPPFVYYLFIKHGVYRDRAFYRETLYKFLPLQNREENTRLCVT